MNNTINYQELHRQLPDYSNTNEHHWLETVKNSIPDSILAQIGRIFRKSPHQLYLSPVEAATLLHYHPNNQRYQSAIQDIEQQFDATPLIEQHRSRHEHDFRNKLQSTLELHPAFRGFSLSTQHYMQLSGRHYFVDFKLELPTETIYIEFDEDAHQKDCRYVKNDPIRNEDFANAGLKLVRVRHKEADIWLDVVAKTGQIKRYEEFMRDLLNAANINTKRNKRGRIALTAKSLSR